MSQIIKTNKLLQSQWYFDNLVLKLQSCDSIGIIIYSGDLVDTLTSDDFTRGFCMERSVIRDWIQDYE